VTESVVVVDLKKQLVTESLAQDKNGDSNSGSSSSSSPTKELVIASVVVAA
jgi:hypothetical protein